MKRLWATLALASAAALGLTACGSASDIDEQSVNEQPVQAEVVEEAVEEDVPAPVDQSTEEACALVQVAIEDSAEMLESLDEENPEEGLAKINEITKLNDETIKQVTNSEVKEAFTQYADAIAAMMIMITEMESLYLDAEDPGALGDEITERFSEIYDDMNSAAESLAKACPDLDFEDSE